MSIRIHGSNFYCRFKLNNKSYERVCKGCKTLKEAEAFEAAERLRLGKEVAALKEEERRIRQNKTVVALIENYKQELTGAKPIPLAEAYGVRLPMDYDGGIPPQMRMMDVPEGEYIVFEHGPFDFETENAAVEAQIEQAMKDFDYEKSGYRLDLTPERVFYFFHDCKRYWKYVRPVVRKESDTSKQV